MWLEEQSGLREAQNILSFKLAINMLKKQVAYFDVRNIVPYCKFNM